jgi:uncharacterized membrane protein/protein-disulfide isomerase
MTPRRRWLILVAALAGLAFAGAASYVHYKLITEPSYVSPCDISARFSCSDLYLSSYGAWHGVPVALAGVLFFGMVAIVAAAEPLVRNNTASGALLFVLSTVGVAASAYFGAISLFVMKSGCVLCIGTYASALALFVLSIGSVRGLGIASIPDAVATELRGLLHQRTRVIALVLFAVASAGLAALFPKPLSATTVSSSVAATSRTDVSAEEQRFDDAWSKQPRIDLGISADGAKVVIVKFNDWQCSACKATFYGYKPLLDQYAQSMPGAIKYVTKDFPLNSKCNFAVPIEMHPAGCEAAVAVRLATAKGKAEAMQTWLFANQESLTPASVAAQAAEMLGVDDFGAEYARLLPAVKGDISDGAALSVERTPTYYINGIKAHGDNGAILPPQYIDYAIRYELRRAEGR